mmetsp:Transcript_30207/g.50017  ORF Transcript_30207/g.50017 Transcript_30207/m.50017 type:complete len:462 (+) Transcript_30207:125-1510(+)
MLAIACAGALRMPVMKFEVSSQPSPQQSMLRRGLLTSAAAASSVTAFAANAASLSGHAARLRRWGPVLGGPFDFPSASRATVRRDVVPGRIWSFEQVQGVIYVHVPVRMTVVKLNEGGLFVYAPVAPTAECLQLLAEVEAEAGPVRHILLPSLALEHKYFAGAFARSRPSAKFWVASYQYSFPLNLPLWAQGFPADTRVLPDDYLDAPPNWAKQLPYRTLGPLTEKVGGYQEVVVFDTATKSLLVTDLVVSIPDEPPAVLRANDERALLYHSRDFPADQVQLTDEACSIGWRKICLFALYFQSSPLAVASPPDGTLSGAVRFFRAAFPPEVTPTARALGWNGFFAWSWRPAWRDAFETLRNSGRPLVPPILQVAVLNREPQIVIDFVHRVADDFAFVRICPCHFAPEVSAGPREWSEAFDFLRKAPLSTKGALPDADLAFLREFEQGLVKLGSIRSAAPKV